MSWYEFVFSEKPGHRIRRHLIFWLAWWLYFAVTYYYYLQVGLQSIVFGKLSSVLFLKTLLLILLHASACYYFIYILLPRFLITKKYFQLFAGVVLVVSFLLAAGYVIHTAVFPLIEEAYHYKLSANNTIWWTNINSGLLNGPKVIAAATAIRLVKHWYLKQKEKERLEKEKLITDLQLMKAQIRPGFLFSSLEQIYEAAVRKSPEAPELLIKLADFLSYLLYECDELKVPLEKELGMMKDYMMLEKARQVKSFELETVVKGELENKKIAPLLLLPFIENSFSYCRNQREQPWMNLEISTEENNLLMKLLRGVDVINDDNDISSPEIKTVEKRLELLYPGKHELKKYIENEIFVVLLKINLGEKNLRETSLANEDQLKTNYVYN